MENSQKESNVEKIYQYLLIALAFFFPLTTAGGNLIVGLIVLLWFFSGNYKFKFNQIIGNKLAVSSMLFFSLHIIGLLWTEDLEWGLIIIKKMWYFLLLLPILLTITQKKYIKHYITAFILAITFTEALSYLIWFEVIQPFHKATIFDPTPFMSHVSYNPFLAFSIYIVGHETLFNLDMSKYKRYLYSLFFVSMSANMFITGGRAGQVVYFILIFVLFFQFFKGGVKSFLASLVIMISVFYTAYSTSDIFHERVDLVTTAITQYSENKRTSVGYRIAYTLNSWEIIRDNLFFGVGTGDFNNEYKKIHMKNTPEIPNTVNPHNMYALILVELGLFGLFGLMYIFYIQITKALQRESKFLRDVGLVMPLMFLIIMWSDSYLLGHYTTLLFIFFSSFLYKDFEKT